MEGLGKGGEVGAEWGVRHSTLAGRQVHTGYKDAGGLADLREEDGSSRQEVQSRSPGRWRGRVGAPFADRAEEKERTIGSKG